MAEIILSGNAIVDAIGKLNITGDVVPLSWLREITFDNGLPDFAGAILLADLVYWYRPSVTCEENGQIKWNKKFRSDLVQMGYAQINERFNLTHNQAADALSRLEKRGLLKRRFRTIYSGGIRCNNVMFLEIVPEKVAEITYSIYEDDNKGVSGCIAAPMEIYPDRYEDLSDEYTETMHTGVGSESQTNTKNTTEIINKDYQYINQVRDGFKDQIDYDCLIIDYPLSKRQLDEIVELSTEILASDRSHIRVNGESQPIEFVKDRFRMLRMSHIQYVLDSLKVYKGGASNIRGYLITTLFNAATTMEHYYGIKVNHELSKQSN